jgi:hypothetical protein
LRPKNVKFAASGGEQHRESFDMMKAVFIDAIDSRHPV